MIHISYATTNGKLYSPTRAYMSSIRNNSLAIGHFFNQFQHLADQNWFWSAKFTAHFQWDSNPIFRKTKWLISDPYLYNYMWICVFW